MSDFMLAIWKEKGVEVNKEVIRHQSISYTSPRNSERNDSTRGSAKYKQKEVKK